MVKKVLSDYQRSKEDNTDDLYFYAQPRLVHHLDESFRLCLTELYSELIESNSIILDLMSSWTSHLPTNIQYKKVIGHGLNKIELEKNTRLDSYWVQNLNSDQKLPLEDSSIDVCLIVAAWQYLQQPEEIAAELKRIIRPKGLLIVSFSNRAFWSKAPKIWTEGSDIDHINYINSMLISQGWAKPKSISKQTMLKGFLGNIGIHGDPFFSIIATN